jgi:hypothetical protein
LLSALLSLLLAIGLCLLKEGNKPIWPLYQKRSRSKIDLSGHFSQVNGNKEVT